MATIEITNGVQSEVVDVSSRGDVDDAIERAAKIAGQEPSEWEWNEESDGYRVCRQCGDFKADDEFDADGPDTDETCCQCRGREYRTVRRGAFAAGARC